MRMYLRLLREKRWLAYGSIAGGVLGALAIHLNESLPSMGGLSFGMPMGPVLSIALGMVGGIAGGAVGSFISGAFAGEDVAMNLGESLGVGLLNGFVAGTAVGAVIGILHRIWPWLITSLTLSAAMALALFAGWFLLRRIKRGEGTTPQ